MDQQDATLHKHSWIAGMGMDELRGGGGGACKHHHIHVLFIMTFSCNKTFVLTRKLCISIMCCWREGQSCDAGGRGNHVMLEGGAIM